MARYPASLLQRQFWLAQQQDPGGSAYNVASAHWVRGDFDRACFLTCIRDVVASHAILRSTYELSDGELWQICRPEPFFDLREHVVSSGGEPRSRALDLLKTEAARPFDLGQGPVVRVVFVSLPERNETAIGIIFHHVAIDLHSNGLVQREIAARYAAAVQGLPFVPASARPEYEAYVHWQSEWLTSDAARSAAEFWRRHLAHADLSPPIPTDFARLETPTFRGGNIPFSLSPRLNADLLKFAHESNLAPYVVLLATYRLLLCRYTQSANLVVGLPLTNRRLGGFGDTIGCFVNIVPMACECALDSDFHQLTRAIRRSLLEAHRHQELPFASIVNEIPGSRLPDRNPLFQAGFTQEPPVALDLPGLDVESHHIPTGGAQLDLFFRFWNSAHGVEGQLDFNTALFRPETAERMVENFKELLATALAEPARPGNQLSLLSPTETAQIRAINSTQVSYPFIPIHERISETARENGSAPAVVFEDTVLTYGDLERRANQLAHRLLQLGTRPESLVAVYMERSHEMVIALVGILKAGAAYVPVDPDYPAERVAFMLSDAAAPVVITQSHLADRLPPTEARLLCLDAGCAVVADEADSAPALVTAPGSLAYMIYTSGSTGQPKGAMNTHRGIDNRLCWMQEQYRMTTADVVMQKTPFSFDVSVWEFFWPLIIGAQLVVARPGGHRDPRYISKLIQERNVTILHFVPPMLRHFLEEPESRHCTTLRHVVCSGEALPHDLQESFFARFDRAQLHNLYGPTEAAVDVTHWTCRRNDPRTVVPIGHPVANTQVYILDAALQPMPFGVPGELYLGGVQIGRGYHNRPQLTAERFLPDPFSQDPNARLYKTGDLCRWLPDGALEFIGRIDGQVKIRGFRIELGEIEAVARNHPDVADAVAFLRDRPGGEKQIIALIKARDGISPIHELRALLRARLPDYMQPAVIVEVAAIPMLPNGKIDRRSLEALVPRTVESNTSPRALDDQTQRTIAAIWEEVLQQKVPDADTNFFEMGGDSLRLLSVRSKLQHAFAREIELMDMFRSPTVRLLARLVSSGSGAKTESSKSEAPTETRVPISRDRFAARRARLARDPGTGHP